MAGDQVLGAAENELHPLVQTAADSQRQRAGHHGGTAHIGLHRQHVVRGLHGVATGIKSDPLAHQRRHHGRIAITGRVVVELQQHRLALAATANRPDPDMAGLAQRFTGGDAGSNLIPGQTTNEQQGRFRQTHGVDLFRTAIGDVTYPASRLEQRIQFTGFRVALLAKIQFTRSLGGVEPLGERVATLQIPAFTDQRHPLDPARFEATGGALNGTQNILLLTGGTKMDQCLVAIETELGALAPIGGRSLGG